MDRASRAVLRENDGRSGARAPAISDGPALRNRRATGARPRVPAILGVLLALSTGFPAEAGDILRGGAAANPSRGAAPFGTNPPATDQARARAKDTLARSTLAVQAVKAMQDAARQAARAGPQNLGLNPNRPGVPLPRVPNGLGPGGLQVAPGVPRNLKAPATGEDPKLWQGAELPRQALQNGQTNVTIAQRKQQAILTWKTFNIGKDTTLTFDQSAGGASRGQWIAFNKILDPSGAPSQILGSIRADGQVYVINQNGIIFGGSSQVNAHTLVASSLPINDTLIARGLLNQEAGKVRFLFSANTADPAFQLPVGTTTYTLAQKVARGTAPHFTFTVIGSTTTLTPGTDYTLGKDATGKTVATFTPAGLGKVGQNPLTAAYTTASGDVTVQAGAQLTSPTTPAHVGGRIALVGPNVTNAGTISTADGQTILAAGRQVGFTEHPSNDPNLRGLDVYVGAVDALSGVATNAGLIDAPRADTTIAGKVVNQLGVIDSSTSVSLNGRIDLLADYGAMANAAFDPTKSGIAAFLFQSTGTVNVGAESLARILPELESEETAVGSELALRSVVKIQGQVIRFGAGSSLLAPNSAVTVEAGAWNYLPPESNFVNATGQIYFEPGAGINVTGTGDVSVPITQNLLDLQLRGAEFADSPLQRQGLLRGTDITVDLRNQGTFNGFAWVGTPLGDVSGFAGLIQHNVGELTTAGGTVKMSAGEAVIMQPGSIVDVSGGWISYQGGMVKTTRLWAGGQLLDIAQATPDRVYDGIYTGTFTREFAKYGITETYTNVLALSGSHFEASYLQGAAGGSIAITAPAMALDGQLLGQVTAGPRQRQTPAAASELALSFRRQPVGSGIPPNSPTPPKITFQSMVLKPADPFALDAAGMAKALRVDRQEELALSPALFTSGGFGKLTIDNVEGDIVVPRNVEITTPAGGALILSAANIDLQGKVTAPSGTLNFTAYNYSPLVQADNDVRTPFPPLPKRGSISLGAQAELNAVGLIVDDSRGVSSESVLSPNGGTISLVSYSADLQPGSVIDVSGGISITATGKRSFGSGGKISIAAGQDPGLGRGSVLGGDFVLGATLRGFAGSKGGTLAIRAPLIQIGGTNARPDTLVFAPSFFSQGGFTNFSLTGLGAATPRKDEFLPGVLIAPGTLLAPVAENWLALPYEPGSDRVVLATLEKPVGLRTPVSLSFDAPGVLRPDGTLLIRGNVTLGAGATIITDPKASVSINAQTVAVLGSIFAPAGTITITGASKYPLLPGLTATQALATVYLAPSSILSAAGTTLLVPDAFGRRIGSVLGGGTISVSGNIVADRGALLDVSGASDTLDLAPAVADGTRAVNGLVHGAPAVPYGSGINAPLWSTSVVPTRLESDGGTITLTGREELFVDATLLGRAGGATALGGNLVISSSRFVGPNDPPTTPASFSLQVTQSGLTRPQVLFASGETALGKAVVGAAGNPLVAMGYFTADTFAAGGFDSLSLLGNVRFSGPVTINARRDLVVASGGVLSADAHVDLTAAHAVLGTPFMPPASPGQQAAPFLNNALPFPIPPRFGPGSLTVTAGLIEIGNLSLQNIGHTRLIADGGDLRGDGTLDVAGDLYLRAGQIYPVSATQFKIVAYDATVGVASSVAGQTAVTLSSAALPSGFGVGSPLLGSTVASISGTQVTLQAGANATVSNGSTVFAEGRITIRGSGQRDLPLSAGGQLALFASRIDQGGVLRAPAGTIQIGWEDAATAPKDLLSGAKVPLAQQVTLRPGSITSVSLVDPVTGVAALIPYGLSTDGSNWIDPTGTDISAGKLARKQIGIAGVSLDLQSGSTIDLSGGGDLYAYRFLKGNGGSTDLLEWNLAPDGGGWKSGVLYKETQIVSYQGAFYYARTDLTADVAALPPAPGPNWKQVTQSFAVIPDYQANFAPYGAFSGSTDPGYVQAGLNVGDRVHLAASDALPAGTYTLLPARYALLPGAVLVTPQAGVPVGTFANPDGGNFVSGYRFNDLSQQRELVPTFSRFEVASQDVIRSRVQFADYLANTFLTQRAQALEVEVPRLPADAGTLRLLARTGLILEGNVLARGLPFYHNAAIDIAGTAPGITITIAATDRAAGPNQIFLNAARLSQYGAESLLLGGYRDFGTDGAKVTVTTDRVTIDNAGAPLTGPEIILAARKNLTVEANSQIIQTGLIAFGKSDPLFLGTATTLGSGDGVLLRVSSDPNARVTRTGVDTSDLAPTLTIKGGVLLSGGSLILDSTAGTTIAPSARLDTDTLSLNSGQIVLQLDPKADVPDDSGLVLQGALLASLQHTATLSLLTYRSLDIYGSGTFAGVGNLTLHAAEIRGFANGGGNAKIQAGSITLDNRAGTVGPGPDPALGGTLAGTLELDAARFRIGAGHLQISQFQLVDMRAPAGLLITGTGSLKTQGDFHATTAFVTAGGGIKNSITALGDLTFDAAAGQKAPARSGLGATLTLQGSKVTAQSDFILPSGSLTLSATGPAATDGITIGGHLAVGGTSQTFYDQTRYTSGGTITLQAKSGDITIDPDATLDVSAQPGGGDAGSVALSVPNGDFILQGKLRGQAGAGGRAGSFALDVRALPTTNAVAATLDAGGFTEAQSFRVRTGDVTIDSLSQAHRFQLSTDAGNLTVTKTIDASGITGGRIDLVSAGDLTVASGALLDASGEKFSNAGKGGAITLEAGAQINGVVNYAGGATLDLQSGATIDLSVAAVDALTDPAAHTAAVTAAQALGQFTGTLHLRAPQTAAGTGVNIAPVAASVQNASSIVVEGYRLFDLQQGGTITKTGALQPLGGVITAGINVQGSVQANGTLLTANSTAIRGTLFSGANAGLASIATIVPGAEIINRTGDLTLGAANILTSTGDWDLASYHFDPVTGASGPVGVPGVLTLRAANNLVFFNALSDGFKSSLFNAELSTMNPALAANAQSWSYRLSAGADLSAADFHRVQSLETFTTGNGSLLLGKNLPPSGTLPATIVSPLFQVIRTGSGDIDISTGRDVELRNLLANIYTAGTRLSDAAVSMGGTFDVPQPRATNDVYPAQFSLAGGNVYLAARGNIARNAPLESGTARSEEQLPINWLSRRGRLDESTGNFGISSITFPNKNEIASTTWWVHFSNFFEGVGALGGGDVSLQAGGSILNVDAVIPTNARLPGKDANGNAIAPDSTKLVELGGGDLLVRAGGDIDGGVYYVERGHGILQAGGEIKTNATRNAATSDTDLANGENWLPTTLFAGKASFDVSALGDINLGPVANPFLLPSGFLNDVRYRSYFSTYTATNQIRVSSISGDVFLRASTVPPASNAAGSAIPFLQQWTSLLQQKALQGQNPQTWLRLTESGSDSFSTGASLMPSTLQVTAFLGDINLIGRLALAPAPLGTVELVAAGAINGLQPSGGASVGGVRAQLWTSALLNLSDADPAALPGISSPLAFNNYLATHPGVAVIAATPPDFFASLNGLFAETGSTATAFSAKLALHDNDRLHRSDPNPARLYALGGDISGLTFFSGKSAQILASENISDIAFYLQNVAATDASVIAAGRDIIAFNANSTLRAAATAADSGNYLAGTSINGTTGAITIPDSEAGDLQISGPGTLEVLAGRNLDLGSGPNRVDGTGTGIVSIGNGRNPALPFAGANLIAAAGIGPSAGLAASALNFEAQGGDLAEKLDRYEDEILQRHPELEELDFKKLSPEQQAAVALDVFFLTLRDSGRAHADPLSPTGNYEDGNAAIAALLGKGKFAGDITTQARDIRTRNGGAITLLAPGGKLTLGSTKIGNPLIPPGIVTESGGAVSIFTDGSIDLGISRIFTLRGGDIVIWSSHGDIAAGSSAKTVKSAPPTRVLVDLQSADVQTDLAGLATGGGIGVLATVTGVAAGDVDLIAPTGVVDAGDAGIRASGNLNIAATQVLNADNIQVAGTSAGVPAAPTVAAPNLGGLTTAQTAGAGGNAAQAEATKQAGKQPPPDDLPSIITVVVLEFTGGEDEIPGGGAL